MSGAAKPADGAELPTTAVSAAAPNDGSERTPHPDEHLIVAAVLDYVEGWFDGHPGRMERALHPELVKRGVRPEDALAETLHQTTATEMIADSAEGLGRAQDVPERRLEIEVVDVHGQIATALFRSAVYREYLHLVRTAAGWKIIHALYRRT